MSEGGVWAASRVSEDEFEVLAGDMVKGELEEIRRSLSGAAPMTDRDLLLCTALFRRPEMSPWWVVAPGELEAKLLRLVAQYRVDGVTWTPTLQLVALRADRFLRELGVVRRRWRDACGVLGIEMADAVDRYYRRWWWPCEVPARPVHRRGGDDRPVGARPVVWLPYYDGEPDCLGLGEGWCGGEVLVVSAELVVEAWGWRPPPAAAPAPSPLPWSEPVARQAQVSAAYVDEGLRGLEEFLRGDVP